MVLVPRRKRLAENLAILFQLLRAVTNQEIVSVIALSFSESLGYLISSFVPAHLPGLSILARQVPSIVTILEAPSKATPLFSRLLNTKNISQHLLLIIFIVIPRRPIALVRKSLDP